MEAVKKSLDNQYQTYHIISDFKVYIRRFQFCCNLILEFNVVAEINEH